MPRLRDSFGFGGGPTDIWAVLAVASFIGLLASGWHTYKGLRDGKQLETSCEEYIRKHHDAHWLKLSGCEYDFEHYAYTYRGSKSSIEKVYIVLRPVDDTRDRPHIVLLRDDDDTIDLIKDFEAGREPSEALVERMQKEIAKPVEGLVLSSFEESDISKLQGADLKLGLKNDFVVIEHGARPHLLYGLLGLAASLVGGSTAGVLFLRARRRKQPSVQPPPPPTEDPPAPSDAPALPPLVVRTPPI